MQAIASPEEVVDILRTAPANGTLMSFGGTTFEPTVPVGFRGPYGMHVEFFRDKLGQVAGFRLYADQTYTGKLAEWVE